MRLMRWFSLMNLLCRSEKYVSLRFLLTNSRWRRILFYEIRRRCHKNLIFFYLRRRRTMRSNSFLSSLSLNEKSSGFGCHHAWWIYGWICWKKNLKLLNLLEGDLDFKIGRSLYVEIRENQMWSPQTESLFISKLEMINETMKNASLWCTWDYDSMERGLPAKLAL